MQPTVFIHIFKAAGTSIHQQLRTNYGVEAVPRVNDGKDFLTRMSQAAKEPGTKVIAGHFRFARAAEAFGTAGLEKPLCFSFVRNPVDRFISAYNYFRCTPGEKWHIEATALGLDEFVGHLVEHDPNSIVNHQCRALSERAEPSFDAARDNIAKNFAFVGCTDQLENINEASDKHLGIRFDRSLRRNVSEKVVTSNDLSTKALNLLKEITAEDVKLYQFVKQTNAKSKE